MERSDPCVPRPMTTETRNGFVLGSTELGGQWAQLRRCWLIREVTGPDSPARDYCMATVDPPIPWGEELLDTVLLTAHFIADRVFPPSRVPLDVLVYRVRPPSIVAGNRFSADELETIGWCELYRDLASARSATAR